MEYRICVFAGTTEGRKLAGFIAGQSVNARFFAATKYGGDLLPEASNILVSRGRLSGEEIEKEISKESVELVIDATHPYAKDATYNIKEACGLNNVEYIRLLRSKSSYEGGIRLVDDTKSAAEFLDNTTGNILLATGSKELKEFKDIKGFKDRVFARVLPMESSVSECREAGLKPSHIIAMQGPFSKELNIAMIRHTNASWLVTKDGSDPGGFEEKAAAAKETGASLLVIGRPWEPEGMEYPEVVKLLQERYGLRRKTSVTIAGIGPGALERMTDELKQAVKDADCLIGAGRMLRAAEQICGEKPALEAVSAEKIISYIDNNFGYENFLVLMSGDPGFFSGAKSLAGQIKNKEVKIIPGISSMSYLCSVLKTSYDDAVFISLHGREGDIAGAVRENKKVFALLDKEHNAVWLINELIENDLKHVMVHLGENLSYPEEKVISKRAFEMDAANSGPLCAVLIENERAEGRKVSYGLSDQSFIRSKESERTVPMTKEEIRAVCLSKLRLCDTSVCYDIGAGTGSVAVEMAILLKKGRVYAIEKRADAVKLIIENKKHFKLFNMDVIEGEAPEALFGIEAPTHAFIGGSSNNLKEIIKTLLEKNPQVRIVATSVTLESSAELSECMESFGFRVKETVCVNVARNKKAGSYNLMTAQNPVYIFTMER